MLPRELSRARSSTTPNFSNAPPTQSRHDKIFMISADDPFEAHDSRRTKYAPSIFRSSSREVLEDDESFRGSFASNSASTLDSADRHNTDDNYVAVEVDVDVDVDVGVDVDIDGKAEPEHQINGSMELEMTEVPSQAGASTVKFNRDSILHRGKKIFLNRSDTVHHTTRSRIYSINTRRYNLGINREGFTIHNWIIYPDSFSARLRQAFLELLCVAIAVVAPFVLSFDNPEDKLFTNHAWMVSSWLVSAVFFVDFVTEFFTAVKTDIGHFVTDRREIAVLYFRIGWLLIDFIAMIPIVAFADTSDRLTNGVEQWTSFRTLTCFAMLFKLTKVIKYESMFANNVIR